MKKVNIKDLIIISLFAGLTAVGAYIKIPIPYVPITLQVLFCAYSGILLGAKRGLYSQLLYLVIGLIGIPVFTNGGGPSYILHPTFGYIVGFSLCSYIIGRLTENMEVYKFHRILGSILVGLSGLYLIGLTHFYIIMNFYLHKPMTVKATILAGFVPFILTDLTSATIASLSSLYILPILKKSGLLPKSA